MRTYNCCYFLHTLHVHLTKWPHFSMVYTTIKWRRKMFKTQVEPRAAGECFHCKVLNILWWQKQNKPGSDGRQYYEQTEKNIVITNIPSQLFLDPLNTFPRLPNIAPEKKHAATFNKENFSHTTDSRAEPVRKWQIRSNTLNLWPSQLRTEIWNVNQNSFNWILHEVKKKFLSLTVLKHIEQRFLNFFECTLIYKILHEYCMHTT